MAVYSSSRGNTANALRAGDTDPPMKGTDAQDAQPRLTYQGTDCLLKICISSMQVS